MADRIRSAVADHSGLRPVARIGARAGLPADRWRAALEPRRPPARLRQSRGRRPVRRRAVVPGDARRGAPDRRRRARRERPGDPRRRDRQPAGHARHRPDADHRRRPPAPGRAGAPRRVGRRQGQARLGRGHGPVHRRGLRDGDLSVVRRQRLQVDRRQGSVALHRPDRVGGLRARLGVQDDDRGGGADEGHRDRVDAGSRTSARCASTRAGPRSTTPTARGWAG